MNKRLKLSGVAIFSYGEPNKPLIVEGFTIDQVGDNYTLSFRITDPNGPVKRFEEPFKEKDETDA